MFVSFIHGMSGSSVIQHSVILTSDFIRRRGEANSPSVQQFSPAVKCDSSIHPIVNSYRKIQNSPSVIGYVPVDGNPSETTEMCFL